MYIAADALVYSLDIMIICLLLNMCILQITGAWTSHSLCMARRAHGE